MDILLTLCVRAAKKASYLFSVSRSVILPLYFVGFEPTLLQAFFNYGFFCLGNEWAESKGRGGGSAWRKNGTTITWQLRTVAFTHTHTAHMVYFISIGALFLETEVQLQVSRQTGRQAGDNRAFHMPFYAICSLIGIYHSDTTQSTNMPLD